MSDWDGIEEFVAVAERGSFKAGAEALGKSTSFVSRAVMRLEDRLDAPLFFRTTRQVTLTDTGRLLVDHCRQLVREREETFALIAGNAEPQGELRITCAAALGERFVSKIVRNYVDDYPRLSVFLDLANRRKDLVAEGYDLAIRTGTLEDSRLVQTLLARRRWRVCASKEYIARKGMPSCVEDLDDHACILGTSEVWAFDVDGQAVEYRPTAQFRCNSGVAVLDAVLAGTGICRLPEFYFRDALRDGRLETVLDAYCAPPEPIWAVYPHRRHLLPKVYMLVDRLKSELDKEMNRDGS